MVKRILIIFLSFILLLSGVVNGFYSYEKRFVGLKLNRNVIKPSYTLSYDNTKIKSRKC